MASWVGLQGMQGSGCCADCASMLVCVTASRCGDQGGHDGIYMQERHAVLALPAERAGVTVVTACMVLASASACNSNSVQEILQHCWKQPLRTSNGWLHQCLQEKSGRWLQ
jgi:hypothetical protein